MSPDRTRESVGVKLVRRALLPALVAAPAVHLAAGLLLAGPSSLAFFSFSLQVLLVWAGLILAGLLIVGLPAAALIGRLDLPPVAKAALLVLIGAAGGGLFAAAIIGMDFRLAPYGLLPGAIAASVWLAINRDWLAPREAEDG